MEKLKKIIMENWMISVSLLFLSFLFFPIIFYFTFMTWEYPNLYMQDNPWIGFIGGYFGAIFGGVVSGLFTFLGIRYTIKNNEKEKFLNTYFEKKITLDEVINELNRGFINLQHLPTEEKITFLVESLPTLNQLVNIIKNDIGGSIARKISFLLKMHETIGSKSKANLKHTSREELAKTHFDYILTIHKELREYGEKLDDIYSKYK